MSKFKKVHSDEHKTTLRHDDGHELVVAHKALSPKMRSQLAKLPMAESKAGQSTAPGTHAKAFAEGGNVEKSKSVGEGLDPYGIGAGIRGAVDSVEKTVRGAFADGGEVPYSKEGAKKVEKGATEGWNLDWAAKNLKEAFEPEPTPTPSPKTRKYAFGTKDGPVSEEDISIPPAASTMEQPAIPTNPATTEAESPEQRFTKEYQQRYEMQRKLNPGEPEEVTKQAATEYAKMPLREEQQQKQSAQQQVQEHYERDKAYIDAQNKDRASLGLSPLPLPVPPAEAMQAAASHDQGSGMQQPSGAPGAAPAQGAATPANPLLAGTEALAKAKESAFQMGMAGIQGGAEADIKNAEAQKAALNRGIGAQQATLASYQQHLKALDQEHQNFMHDYQNQHIDPQHYFSSMTTPGKISTAIGLILGGIGAGIAGQRSNPAMDFLNAQIDRDINAQKQEMEKTHNLLRANMEQYKNLYDATNVTRAQQMGILQSQLEKAAMTASTEKAKSAALTAASKLMGDQATIYSQVAAHRAILDQANSGMLSPEQAIQFSPILNDKQKSEAMKEVDDMKHIMGVRDQVLKSFDDVAKAASVAGRHPLNYRSTLERVGTLVGELSKLTAGRFSEMDADMIKKNFAGVLDSTDPKLVAAKRDALRDLMNNKVNFGRLTAVGIDPYKYSKYDQQGKSKYQESAPITKKR